MRAKQAAVAIVDGANGSLAGHGHPHQPVNVFHRLDSGLNHTHGKSIILEAIT